MIFDAGNERSAVRRFVPAAGTASCTFVRQTGVCPTKVLALRGRGIRRCRTLYNKRTMRKNRASDNKSRKYSFRLTEEQHIRFERML